MTGGIEDVVTSWLSDPAWQKVFKHTLDVLEDYVSYILLSVGAVALSVKVLTTLSTGDLVCIVIGIENATTPGSILPYAEGGTLGMLSYAQTDEDCIRKAFTPFMEYLPYVLLLQTLVLVIIEKFTFRIPRIAQKVERFYRNIVEESLFGKDPDVTEDLTDPKTRIEAISRQRQRNEICVSLKRSSIIHHVYIGKNVAEMIVGFICLVTNAQFALATVEDSVACRIPIGAFPEVHINSPGAVYFQCRGKKFSFFMLALWTQVALLGMHFFLSTGAVIWCFKFRSVSSLIKTVESMRRDQDWEPDIVSIRDGEDFLFLFDLLAHTCGLESTLRVLTHSDEKFYQICKPKLDPLQLEEDKLKISWKPADIERWLHTGDSSGVRSHRSIGIDSYEVTIFPAESVKHSQTLPAWRGGDSRLRDGLSSYSTWFYDLIGGRTEYVVTIAIMIGKSRMKGEKVVTNLVPYGPDKPRTGMQKSAGTDQVEIFWDPPKGEFTKYTLIIEKMPDPPNSTSISLLNQISVQSNEPSVSYPDAGLFSRANFRHMENLSYKLTSYTIMGLLPAERYRVELGTKTGNVATRQSIDEVVLTKPLAPSALVTDDITSATATIRWLTPEGHSCLRGFQISVLTMDSKIFKSFAVSKTVKMFKLKDLSPSTDYNVHLTSMAVADTKRYESDPVKTSLTTLPEPIRNLRLDYATPNSIVIKWDASVPAGSHNHKVRLAIEGVEAEHSQSIDVLGDKGTFNFSRLPDPEGSGCHYGVTVKAVVTLPENREVISDPVKETFATIPLLPSNIRLDPDTKGRITWLRSQTPRVTGYRVRWKSVVDAEEEGPAVVSSSGLALVNHNAHHEEQEYVFESLTPKTLYKVNITAVVRLPERDEILESKELHEKIWTDVDCKLSIN